MPFGLKELPEIHLNAAKGRVGCTEFRTALNALLEPMRECRSFYESRPGDIDDILSSGTRRAYSIAQETMQEAQAAMSMNYFRDMNDKKGVPGP